MRLRKIQARNYRTLENIDLTLSPNYCTISGKNNAGKSAFIRLLVVLLGSERGPWLIDDYDLNYKADLSQWVKGEPPIDITYTLFISRADDPTFVTFIEKMEGLQLGDGQVEVVIRLVLANDEEDEPSVTITVGGTTIENAGTTKEIRKKLIQSNALFLHNSTTRSEFLQRYYGGPGNRSRLMYEVFLSAQEHKSLLESAKVVERRIKRLAQAHRSELNTMLGKLADKYDVEFSSLRTFTQRQMPLSINLRDKNVDCPIDEWGSGTQNRTYVLMSILQANRIKTRQGSDEGITPIVVIEEPESFLHPSAQAEFGKLLQALSSELGIQIIASTHSPYILNQADPASNILLRRRLHRKKLKDTTIVDTGGSNWMAPFAEHLGVATPEFTQWRQLFAAHQPKVLLVEGDLDKSYFEHVREKFPSKFPIPTDVEVVPYGGKDALKNTMLVKFVLSKFDDVFITFDLDCADEARRALARLGLNELVDFVPVGLAKPGRAAIEGLLPDRVISAVNGKETDLVMQLASTNTSERKQAKHQLKKKYLEEFRRHDSYDDEELKPLTKLGRQIAKSFASRTRDSDQDAPVVDGMAVS